jgi:hypothetical protein
MTTVSFGGDDHIQIEGRLQQRRSCQTEYLRQ